MLAEYIGVFLIVWVSTVNGVAMTTAGPMTAEECKTAKATAQARANKNTSVTALCVGSI